MTVADALDELEAQLELVVGLLEEDKYDEAAEAAKEISGILDCALCENLEAGVLGGVMFAAGIDQRNRSQRRDMVVQEVRNFIEVDLDQARENLEARLEREMADAP